MAENDNKLITKQEQDILVITYEGFSADTYSKIQSAITEGRYVVAKSRYIEGYAYFQGYDEGSFFFRMEKPRAIYYAGIGGYKISNIDYHEIYISSSSWYESDTFDYSAGAVTYVSYGDNAWSLISGATNIIVTSGNSIFHELSIDSETAKFICLSGFTGTSNVSYSIATITSGNVWSMTTGITIAGGGGGGDTSGCVHLTGDETVAGNKTFTDNVIFSDETQIVFSRTSGGGGTSGITGITATTRTQEVQDGDFSLQAIGIPDWGSPIGVIAWCTNPTIDTTQRVVSFVGNLSGGTGATETTTYHNYTTLNYTQGNWQTTGSVLLAVGTWCVTYFYSQGGATLTFGTSSFSPGSGAYQCTFTGNTLVGIPSFFLMQMETQVRNESYRRVSFYGQDSGATNTMGLTFGSNTAYTTTQYFTVSYNNGLIINSGNQNTGGYTHNPGTYRLYYVMDSQIYYDESAPTPPTVTSYTLSDILQPVPEISTSITADASSDIKTASPKAVKTYVDNNMPTVPDISTNIVNDRTSNVKTASPAAVYSEIHPTTASTRTNMQPNKFYNLGTLTGTVSLTFQNPTDGSIENEYKFQFSTSSTAPTINWPSQITTWLNNTSPTISANKTYQVSVINGLAVIGEF